MADASADRLLKNLLRGVAHDRRDLVKESWGALIALGPEAVAAVKAKIESSDWTGFTNKQHGRMLAVLLGLLQAADDSAASEVIAALKKSRLHPAHARTAGIVESRLAEAAAHDTCCGVRIFVSSEIPGAGDVLAIIRAWLGKLPREHLNGILRIDVIGPSPEMDYLGLHDFRFSRIVLVWPERESPWLLRALDRLRTQKTLYHEVGHHALGHSQGGQEPQQEQEANEYARRQLRRARPVLISALRVLFFPFLLSRPERRPEPTPRMRGGLR